MAKSFISIHWPFVLITSCTLFVLILVTLPFNTRLSTIFLFAFIAYWSRLPGVGIPTPLFILYQADLVDMFSMIVAINIGGLEGAVFSLFGNFASRMAGIFPRWSGVFNDAASQFVICLIIPFIHAYIGNVFITMMVYTLLRRLGFIVGYFCMLHTQFSPAYFFFVVWPGATAVSLIINAFYGRYFGFYLDGILKSGVQFSWSLFLIATIVIIIMWRLMVGKTSSKFLHKGAIMKWIIKKFSKPEKKASPRIRDEEIINEVKEII